MAINTVDYANSLLFKNEQLERLERLVLELEAQNQKLREQRDAANAHIQFLNRVIAGDAE